MKSSDKDTEQMIQVTEAELLSLVGSKLKGRLLFPKKVEDAKKFFNKINISAL